MGASVERMTSEQGWYSPIPILSYGRYLNIVTGNRSSGKSTGWSIKLLHDWLTQGKGWIYTRRTADETDLTAPDWFDNAAVIMRDNGYDVEIEYRGGHYIVNGEEAGIAVPLSLVQKYKSSNLSFCHTIVFDEFISENGRYLGGSSNPMLEWELLQNLRTTADRAVGVAYRNEVKIVALGNNKSYFNPLYIGNEVDKYLRTDTHFCAPKGKLWVVQQITPADVPASAEYKESVGYLLSDEANRAYIYENQTMDQHGGCFVQRLNEPMTTMFKLVWCGIEMTVYNRIRTAGFYVSKQMSPVGMTYALTSDDHRPNYILCSRIGQNPNLKTFKEAYDYGMVTFETDKLKYAIDNFFRYVV